MTMASMNHDQQHPTLSVSFRGKKYDFMLSDPAQTICDIQEEILRQAGVDAITHLKLLCHGKQLTNLDAPILQSLELLSKNKKSRHYKLLATGVLATEAQALDAQLQSAQRTIRVRDDLTLQGQADLEERKRLGQYMLHKAGRKGAQNTSSPYRFGRIETLSNLPDQDTARNILTTLANDPGILACLHSHQWSVGALAELFPDGKVGESAVCVMGLNENKGQRILLRIRTDDLQGFRKMASIRKVLYHELAHNVHSEHDDKFFVLMRQIERECTSMDWTYGAGLSNVGAPTTTLYTGGTYRLGGGSSEQQPSLQQQHVPLRELAAQAAMSRMTQEEHDIELRCGCGRTDLFLPKHDTTIDSSDPTNADTNDKPMDNAE